MSTFRNLAATSALGACLFFAFAPGCGAPAVEERSTDQTTVDRTPPETIVCRRGTLDEASEDVVRECPEGLSCCYPCGVEGCSWVCASPETCESWSTLPSTPRR